MLAMVDADFFARDDEPLATTHTTALSAALRKNVQARRAQLGSRAMIARPGRYTTAGLLTVQCRFAIVLGHWGLWPSMRYEEYGRLGVVRADSSEAEIAKSTTPEEIARRVVPTLHGVAERSLNRAPIEADEGPFI